MKKEQVKSEKLAQTLLMWHNLLQVGAITQEEFDKQKSLLLNGSQENELKVQKRKEYKKEITDEKKRENIRKRSEDNFWKGIGLIFLGILLTLILFDVNIYVGLIIISGGIVFLGFSWMDNSVLKLNLVSTSKKSKKYKVLSFLIPIVAFLGIIPSVVTSQIGYSDYDYLGDFTIVSVNKVSQVKEYLKKDKTVYIMSKYYNTASSYYYIDIWQDKDTYYSFSIPTQDDQLDGRIVTDLKGYDFKVNYSLNDYDKERYLKPAMINSPYSYGIYIPIYLCVSGATLSLIMFAIFIKINKKQKYDLKEVPKIVDLENA